MQIFLVTGIVVASTNSSGIYMSNAQERYYEHKMNEVHRRSQEKSNAELIRYASWAMFVVIAISLFFVAALFLLAPGVVISYIFFYYAAPNFNTLSLWIVAALVSMFFMGGAYYFADINFKKAKIIYLSICASISVGTGIAYLISPTGTKNMLAAYWFFNDATSPPPSKYISNNSIGSSTNQASLPADLESSPKLNSPEIQNNSTNANANTPARAGDQQNEMNSSINTATEEKNSSIASGKIKLNSIENTEAAVNLANIEFFLANAMDYQNLNKEKERINAQQKPEPGDKIKGNSLNESALKLIKIRDFNAASEILKTASDIDPSNAEITNNYGFSLLKSGDFSGAEKLIVRTIQISPSRSAAWVNLAEIYSNQNKTEDSAKSLAIAYQFSTNKEKTLNYIKSNSEKSESNMFKPSIQALELIKKM